MCETLYSASASTRAVERLTRRTAASGYVRYPSWCRDRIVFELAEGRADVWIAGAPAPP